MTEQKKRRLFFILFLLAAIVTVAVIARIDDAHIVGYDNYNDLLKNIAKRNGVSEESVVIDTVREDGPYIFVCYHTKEDSTLYLLYYRSSSENIFSRYCTVLTYRGHYAAIDSVGQHVFYDEDMRIFVVWGDNRKANISSISFDIGGKTICRTFPDSEYYDGYFIEPFFLAYEEESPKNIVISY